MQCQTTTSRNPQRQNPPPNYKQAKPQSSPLSRRFAVARALALSTPTCSGLASCRLAVAVERFGLGGHLPHKVQSGQQGCQLT